MPPAAGRTPPQVLGREEQLPLVQEATLAYVRGLTRVLKVGAGQVAAPWGGVGWGGGAEVGGLGPRRCCQALCPPGAPLRLGGPLPAGCGAQLLTQQQTCHTGPSRCSCCWAQWSTPLQPCWLGSA
jgi:hypothetical protein